MSRYVIDMGLDIVAGMPSALERIVLEEISSCLLKTSQKLTVLSALPK
jgi:hypothetical protein